MQFQFNFGAILELINDNLHSINSKSINDRCNQLNQLMQLNLKLSNVEIDSIEATNQLIGPTNQLNQIN